MMLKCVLCRHIEETAFHLFLLRELDSCKSNMGVRRKTLFWMCSLSMQDAGRYLRNVDYIVGSLFYSLNLGNGLANKNMIATNESSWRDGTLSIMIPLGELADAKKGEFDYDYMIGIDCFGGNKPSVGTNLADYPEIYVSIMLDESSGTDYESGSAVVKSVKDDDYITIEFKNFKCGESSAQLFTVNGTVKLLYDVD